MRLSIQRRLAAEVLNCSMKHVLFDSSRLDEIKESITKADIRSLIKDKAISKKCIKESSRVRARNRKEQKKKGRRKGRGSKKGKKTARLSNKEEWMNRIRSQRSLLDSLKKKGIISGKDFRVLYLKAKGGFFRSKRHIKIYIEDQKMIIRK